MEYRARPPGRGRLPLVAILPPIRCSRGLRGVDVGLGKAIGVPCCVSVRPSMFGLGIMTAERRKGRRIPVSEAGLELIFKKSQRRCALKRPTIVTSSGTKFL